MEQQTKLQMLYELARTGFAIANQTPRMRRHDLEDDVALLLKKSEMVQEMTEIFVKDVAEKLIEARNGIAMLRTVVCVESANGRKSAPFIVATIDIHPTTRFSEDSTAESPMVFDIMGKLHDPRSVQHGKTSYYCVNETLGDKLIVLAEHPLQS